MADYQLLSQDAQDDVIVATYHAQEADHHSHSLNLERYNAILSSSPPGQWQERIKGLRDETRSRLAEVDSIIAATQAQLPTQERIEAAMARLQARGVI